ncbi:MAG: DUF881 domain-containing protein [Clostridia bacterium]|nr:DUF881 domain-containing protein [Clostridia bacterium]MDD4048117.1 DUF881 domain-containing protein [Clostridia bacterium]
MKDNNYYLPLTIVFVFFGILLSLQFQAQNRFASDLSMQKTENLIAMVRGLSDKRQKLALEIVDLSSQLSSQLQNYNDEKKVMESITLQMNKLHIVNGSLPLKGSGLIISIEEFMPIVYTDLIYTINELWAAGAEAISINDHRITSLGTISSAEDDYNIYITVNYIKLEYPIIIKAIGDPNNLEKGLTLPGGIMDNLALFNAFPQLEQIDELEIPSARSPFIYYFLKEYKPEEKSGTELVSPLTTRYDSNNNLNPNNVDKGH